MFKVRVISLILVLFIMLSLSSCKSRDDTTRMCIGETVVFETKDHKHSPSDEEDYARVNVTMLDMTNDYFTVEYELVELKEVDEEVKFIFNTGFDKEPYFSIEIREDGGLSFVNWRDAYAYSHIEVIQENSYNLKIEKTYSWSTELNVGEPVVLRYYYEEPYDGLLPRDCYIQTWMDVELFDPWPLLDSTPYIYFEFSYVVGDILWDEVWTFEWLGELFN